MKKEEIKEIKEIKEIGKEKTLSEKIEEELNKEEPNTWLDDFWASFPASKIFVIGNMLFFSCLIGSKAIEAVYKFYTQFNFSNLSDVYGYGWGMVALMVMAFCIDLLFFRGRKPKQ